MEHSAGAPPEGEPAEPRRAAPARMHLPDGTPYVPWSGASPYSTSWRSAGSVRPAELRARWLEVRARAVERGTWSEQLARRIEVWNQAGWLPRPLATTGSSPAHLLLELACDAAVAASPLGTAAGEHDWPTTADRASVARTLTRGIDELRGPTAQEMLRLHKWICPSFRPTALGASPGTQAPGRSGHLRRERAFVVGSDGIAKEGCPPQKLAWMFDSLARALAPSRGPATLDPAYAAWALYAVCMLHPFTDGNGRLARLIASWVLVRGGGVPFLLSPGLHGPYLDAVAQAHFGEPGGLVRLIDECQGMVLEDLLAHVQ